MAYKMEELSDYLRVGLTSGGDIDIEVWYYPRGWEDFTREPCEVVVNRDDASLLKDYLNSKPI